MRPERLCVNLMQIMRECPCSESEQTAPTGISEAAEITRTDRLIGWNRLRDNAEACFVRLFLSEKSQWMGK